MIPALLFQRLVTKRLAFSLFLFFILYSLFFILPVHAQSQQNNAATQQANPALTTNTNPDVPKNLHTWTQTVMIEVMASMLCQLTGVDPINPNQKCLGVDPKTGQVGFVEEGGGAIGVLSNMIVMTYTPPLRTNEYVSYLAQNFGLAKPAHAQTTGTGFDGISPLLKLWVVFRNLVYMLFIAVFIVMGFGIMLRIHIDPRTVMTIANQLPNAIIAILLVTFSFAIAGFLIDIMWTSIYVTYNVIASSNSSVSNLNPTDMAGKTAFEAAGGFANVGSISTALAIPIGDEIRRQLHIEWCPDIVTCANHIFNPLSPFGAFIDIMKGGMFGVNIPSLVINLISSSVAISYFFKIMTIPASTGGTPIISDVVNLVTTFAKGGAASAATIGAYSASQFTLRVALPVIIPFIIIATALIWALFRIWFQLILAYVSILINVVFAPFWIVGGLFPGSPAGFGGWFREMLANLASFPVTIGMFLLGKVFIDVFSHATTAPFVPPLIGNFANTNLFGSLIGLGIILMTPQVVNMMKDLIKSPQFKYSSAVGQAVGVGTSVTNLPGHASSIGGTLYGLSHVPGLRSIPVLKDFLPGATPPPH